MTTFVVIETKTTMDDQKIELENPQAAALAIFHKNGINYIPIWRVQDIIKTSKFITVVLNSGGRLVFDREEAKEAIEDANQGIENIETL